MGSHSLKPGEEAPSLTLSSNSKVPSPDNTDGKFVVLNFWSASDAASRLNNRRLAEFTASLPSSKIKFISVCTDSDASLSREILSADGIDRLGIHLNASDLTEQVAEDYQTSSGCRSFLIDPFGNLVSISPSHAEIAGIIS